MWVTFPMHDEGNRRTADFCLQLSMFGELFGTRQGDGRPQVHENNIVFNLARHCFTSGGFTLKVLAFARHKVMQGIALDAT